VSTSTLITNERVAAILEAACRVVVRDGAHGLRMTSVADEAGVSKALLHYYFSTRRELLRSAFAFSEQRLNEAVEQELEGLTTGAERAERALVVSVDTETPFGEQRALWNEVWSSLRLDDELRPLVDGSYRAWVDRLVGLIEQGRADGSISASVDAADGGWRLAAVADGIDSMLYLGLIDRDRARELVLGSVDLELRRV
jgi:AcrR family transcriptional regulator